MHVRMYQVRRMYIAFSRVLPLPTPSRQIDVCMRDGDAQEEKHTWMSLFMMLTL